MDVSEQRSGSILAVDFGNVQTRALLIDLVDGFYRLVARGEARTTAGFPANDARLGLNRVVEQITAVTGRNLLTTDGKVISPEQNDRSGVDYFVMTNLNEFVEDGFLRETVLNKIITYLSPNYKLFALVNNAAEQILNKSEDLSYQQWQQTMNVNVTALGNYQIDVPAVNGVTFSTGTTPKTFTTLGVQSVILNASGTPLTSGNFNYKVNSPNTNCTFTIAYL